MIRGNVYGLTFRSCTWLTREASKRHGKEQFYVTLVKGLKTWTIRVVKRETSIPFSPNITKTLPTFYNALKKFLDF